MKPVQTFFLLFSLLVIAKGNVPSIFKRSVTDVDEDVVSIRKMMKTLNMTIGNFFQKFEDNLEKGLLECEDEIRSIVKRASESDDNVDVVSTETLMNTLSMTLEKAFKKFESCSLKSSITCKGATQVNIHQNGGTRPSLHEVPRNCEEVLNKCNGTQSGVYRINPDGKGAFKVYCDQQTNGGGWTVIQRRQDGSVDFYRGWNEYKNGFGNLKGEFWLGLDKINRLTHQTRNRLRVDLHDHEGSSRYAEYDYFAVADERNKYRLDVGRYTGNAHDSLSYHRGMPFSTKDRDNDVNPTASCAVARRGAWWFKFCMHSDLNGEYYQRPGTAYARGINWYKWRGDHYSLKKADMKVRPTNKLRPNISLPGCD